MEIRLARPLGDEVNVGLRPLRIEGQLYLCLVSATHPRQFQVVVRALAVGLALAAMQQTVLCMRRQAPIRQIEHIDSFELYSTSITTIWIAASTHSPEDCSPKNDHTGDLAIASHRCHPRRLLPLVLPCCPDGLSGGE